MAAKGGVETDEPLLPQPLPRPVPRDRSKENRGGYDCEFVEPPTEAFQTECPVCLQILKEPHLISCCGHKFCRECIERIVKDKNACPLCNEPDFTFMRDRGLERSLKELEVWCSYREEGCEWKGKLGELEEHLNRDPSPENQLKGCQFVEVECMHKCGEWFQRRHITTHETQQCKKRPYSCDHCRDYDSTFEDVTEVHYPQCGKYPVSCPNDCDVYKIERQDLESHLKDQCPLALVDCPFHYAGCETHLPRKDMPEHMRENFTHLTLLATFSQTLSIENQRLVKENQELQRRALEREDENQELHLRALEREDENQELHRRALEREDESRETLAAVQTSLQELKDRHVEGVTKQLEADERLTEMDDKISRLYCAHHNVEHSMKVLPIEESYYVRETDLAATFQSTLRNMYLPVFPIDFHVEKSNDSIFSPAFYTHSRGYQMCVRVYPNRRPRGAGEGTHVSIFTCIMPGPFDDYLKWPFRGEITIQVVNQAGDHDHVEKTIPYTDKTPDKSAGRVTDEERSGRWGKLKFLSHDDYHQCNDEDEIQYLKDNHLHIRVMGVKIT